jgi:hypothetical protein
MRRTSLAALARVRDDRPCVHQRRRFRALVGGGIESGLEYAYRRDVERTHGLPKARRAVSLSVATRSDVLCDEYGVLTGARFAGLVGTGDALPEVPCRLRR